jgi:YVTN family beta-propeller protein
MINPTTNTVTATVSVGYCPYRVAFDGTNIWVTKQSAGTVVRINPTTNTVTATVPVGDGPSAVAFDGTNIWVTNLTIPGTVTKLAAYT